MEELFLEACEENSISFCSKYIRKRLNINFSDSDGCTGLMKACLNGHFDLSKLLIESGADLSLKDKNGQNALHYAVLSKNDKLCKYLCTKKIDSNEMTMQAALTPKDYALPTVHDGLVRNPMEHLYMIQTKNIIMDELPACVFERDEAKYKEEKIFNLITRYQEMELSDLESDGDDIQKGEMKKKGKSKRKKGKKSKGSGKKKKGKSKK